MALTIKNFVIESLKTFYEKLSTRFQETLVSGVNLKTVSGETLLGSGNVVIDWKDLSGVPSVFPVETHNHDDRYVKLNGASVMTGDLNLYLGDVDRFVVFSYPGTTNPTSNSWRTGVLGSGSDEANYYVVQYQQINTSSSTWNTAFKIGQSTGNVTFTNNITIGDKVNYHAGNLTIKTLMGTTAIGDADEPVYWNGSSFVKAGAYPTKASWNYDDVYLKLSGGTITGPIKFSNSANNNLSNNYLSAGGGYSSNSGRLGLKLVSIDQSDIQAGIGVDLTGFTYETTISTGRRNDTTPSYITFATHNSESSSYKRLGYFKASGDTDPSVLFHVGGTVEASKFIGSLQGNAATATNAGYATNAGNADTVDGCHAGFANGSVVIYAPFPSMTSLKNDGYISSSYGTEEYGHPDEEFLQGICKWAIATYPNKGDITLMGAIAPNSSGTCILHLYSSAGSDPTTNLPRYCRGLYQQLGGNLFQFGTVNYEWSYGQISAGYATTAGSAPASDVYSWAKQPSKPTYSFSEITPGTATIGNGSTPLIFRSDSAWKSGIYHSVPGNESMVFANINPLTSWMFATADPNANKDWSTLSPSLQIKNGRVTINKLIANGTEASYNLDVNGSANATTLYENGVRVSIDGHTHTKSQITDFPTSLPANGGYANEIASKGMLDSQEKIDNFITPNRFEYALFKTTDANNVDFASNDGMIISIPWASDSYGFQMAFDDTRSGNVKVRGKSNSWGDWYILLHSGNYTSYTVKKDGTGASGTWGISISGNAKTATNVDWNGITNKPTSFEPSSHNHSFTLGATTITTGETCTAITGPFAVNTAASADKAFAINRNSAIEGVKHWVDDSTYHIEYTNDETASSIAIRLINTDIERATDKGANATDVTVYLDSYRNFYPNVNNTGSIGQSSYKWANMFATTFHGSLDGKATYASNVGSSGTVGTNYVTAANVISMYNWYNSITATDEASNTAIDKWNEIVSFLAGIADTSTLSGLLANYLPLTGGTLSGNLQINHNEVDNQYIIYKNNRIKENGGGWADNIIIVRDSNNTNVFNFGVFGIDDSLSYAYLGTNNYDGNNLRIYSDKVCFGSKTIYHSSNLTKSVIESLLTGNITSHTHSQYLTSITKAMVEGVLTGKITSHTHYSLVTEADNRNSNTTPNDYSNSIIFRGLKSNSSINTPTNKCTYSYLVGLKGWSDSSGGDAHELAFNNEGIYRRRGASTTWEAWVKILDSGNFNSYAPKLDGTGATGTWGINITGSAGSVAWDNITGKPATATRWPSWSEVTNKPSTFPASEHNHDGRYLRWNGSAADVSAMTWGTLTAANGYTILSHAASSDGGDWGMANQGGKIYMQLDGYYYQNEGQYRVTDVSETVTALGTNGNYLTWTKNGSTSNITVPYASNAESATNANYFLGCTNTITVAGDANTYYPVMISTTYNKNFQNIITVWKDLGSPTAPYPENHSNGSSSMLYRYDIRNNVWDGNGGYCTTLDARYMYARLVSETTMLYMGVGNFCIWLRGGGTEYRISTSWNISSSDITVYYSSTNVGNSTYPVIVTPRTDIGNGGVYNTISIPCDVKYASYAGSIAWDNVTEKPTTINGYGITDALKIDGSNGTAEGMSALINKLSVDSSDPTDVDYYVCQYAGGGTTNTTYYRRPMSAMWNWIKAKTDTLYPTKTGSGASGTWDINVTGSAKRLESNSSTNIRGLSYYYIGSSTFNTTVDGSWSGYSSNTNYNSIVRLQSHDGTAKYYIDLIFDVNNSEIYYRRVTNNSLANIRKIDAYEVPESTASYSLSSASWTNTITLPTTAGSYILNIVSGNSTLTGVFSIGASDNAKDEISLHLHGNGPRLYARTNGTTLQLSSNDASATSRSVTIKYRRMI